jgi:hypothetical protein
MVLCSLKDLFFRKMSCILKTAIIVRERNVLVIKQWQTQTGCKLFQRFVQLYTGYREMIPEGDDSRQRDGTDMYRVFSNVYQGRIKYYSLHDARTTTHCTLSDSCVESSFPTHVFAVYPTRHTLSDKLSLQGFRVVPRRWSWFMLKLPFLPS